jgi:hypothetical protein
MNVGWNRMKYVKYYSMRKDYEQINSRIEFIFCEKYEKSEAGNH